jgi:DNA gyrase subunit B
MTTPNTQTEEIDYSQITGPKSDPSTYDASHITVLEGLEAVRKRPGMYIGNTGKDGLHRCLGEILDNSVDESMEGHADKIKVYISNKDNCVVVSDNGRGIPTGIHPKTGKSSLETIMTVLHAGGKFDQENYQFAGGLHGVGASVVNALSAKMQVWVLKNDQISYLSFAKGKTVGELEVDTKENMYKKFPILENKIVWSQTGTVTAYYPDKAIFETIEYNIKEVGESLKQTAYLNPGLNIQFEYTGTTRIKKNILEEAVNDVSNTDILAILN